MKVAHPAKTPTCRVGNQIPANLGSLLQIGMGAAICQQAWNSFHQLLCAKYLGFTAKQR